MKNIVIFSLESINNAGEEILSIATSYLLKDIKEINLKKAQLCPNRNQMIKKYFPELLVSKFLFVLSNIIKMKKKKIYQLENIGYIIRFQRCFNNILQSADGVIYAIGMLKYSTQNFSYIFYLINKISVKLNLPVMMSAMSIEKPDNVDWRFNQLVKAVNMPCVKMITTRDGTEGVERLKSYYIKRSDIEIDFTGDPALWIPECYNIARKDSDIIGINLIRKGIYKDYGTDFSGEQLLCLYEEIITEMDKRNKKWCLFCNGIKNDYNVGLELISRLRLSKEKLLPCPKNAEEFISIVSQFKAVFGARLHACITAFSLNIPVSGLLWDDKLEKFSKTMGIREFFSATDELKGVHIVDKLEKAIQHSNDLTNQQLYKLKTKESLQRFVKKWINPICLS